MREDREPARFYAHFLAWDFNAPHTLLRRAGLEEADALQEAAALLAEYSRKCVAFCLLCIMCVCKCGRLYAMYVVCCLCAVFVCDCIS